MRSWASDTLLGPRRRDVLLRAAVAVVLLAALFWLLPIRRAGEEGGHHAAHHGAGDDHTGHVATLDLFERAGVTELKAGQRGPAFRLALLAGGEGSLDAWADRAVVLNFWATWCTPCTLEMPTLEALWREYRGRGLVVAGVSVDRGAPRALLDPYVRNLDLTFPILLDADGAVATRWRVTALPATFIIRPGGEVAGMAIGPREWNSAEMRALLETVLPVAAH